MKKVIAWILVILFLLYASRNPESTSETLSNLASGVISGMEAVFGSDNPERA